MQTTTEFLTKFTKDLVAHPMERQRLIEQYAKDLDDREHQIVSYLSNYISLGRGGKTFKAFGLCMVTAEAGKTFIYHHPDFVAIDRRTWDGIQAKLSPPLTVIVDEFSDITPESEAKLQKWLRKAKR